MGPGRARLVVDVEIGLGDRIGRETAILAETVEIVAEPAPHHLTIDCAINEEMGDVHTSRPILASKRLGQHAQARLGRGKCVKSDCRAARPKRL